MPSKKLSCANSALYGGSLAIGVLSSHPLTHYVTMDVAVLGQHLLSVFFFFKKAPTEFSGFPFFIREQEGPIYFHLALHKW